MIADNSIKKKCDNGKTSLGRFHYILAFLQNGNNENMHFQEYNYHDKNYILIKEICEFSASIINLFYSMIGIKRSYNVLNKSVIYYQCDRCGRLYDNILDTCECRRGFDTIIKREFYAKLRTNTGSGNYFYCPNWYNKIYSNIKCIDE